MTVHSQWHGDRARRAFERGAAEGVHDGLDIWFDGSQRAVPRDTTDLADSGRTSVDRPRLRGEIRYGEGLDDPRAVITHESPGAADTGEPKWLENPGRRLRGQIGAAIAARIRAHLR